MGFTLIALFDGFVVVAVLDLGAPVWLIILAGLAAVLGGRIALERARARLLPRPAAGRSARKERSWI